MINTVYLYYVVVRFIGGRNRNAYCSWNSFFLNATVPCHSNCSGSRIYGCSVLFQKIKGLGTFHDIYQSWNSKFLNQNVAQIVTRLIVNTI
jgi:hypothetical protein